MVRSSQTATASKPVWRQHNFVDHGGNQATSIRWSFEDSHDPNEPSGFPFSFQVYSTLPLDGNLSKLVEYLGSDIFDEGFFPSWEIYAEQPDVFSCVEHERREIAYRKEASQTPSAASDSPSLPLIPKVATDPHDPRRLGFLILITSDSYRGGSAPPNQIDPMGPLWVSFERKYPYKTCVDTASRLENDPDQARRLLGIPIEEIEVLPEKIEILAKRKQGTHAMLNTLSTMYRMSFQNDGRPDYGSDEDEGRPTDQVEMTQGGDNLTLRAQALSLRDFQVTLGLGDTVTVTSSTMTSNPDLRYIVYAPFLHYPGVSDSLESTARAFTSAIVLHLPQGKTIHFEFHKPQDTTLSSIIAFHRTQTSKRPEMSVGALHNIQAQLTRVYPCTRNERRPFFPDIERYKTFAVVLDKPNFVDEAGVLFAMTDGGKLKGNPGDFFGGPNSDYFETQVLRSAGMAEAARRLGMLVLDEM